MKVISRNAAETLFDKVESLSGKYHDSWRCIYLKLSDKQERFNETLRNNFIVKATVDMLAEYEGSIYLCNDGDIFILFQGALKPIVSKLSGHFGDLNPQQLRGQPSDSMFLFFDLGRHWQGFYELCRLKSEHLATPLYMAAPPLHDYFTPRASSGL